MIRSGRAVVALVMACMAVLAVVLWSSPLRADAVPQIAAPITDLADVIPADVEAKLAARLEEHRAATKVHVAVLTVESTGGVPIDDYALRVATQWAGGSRGGDDGALFVLAVADRQMRLELGYGVEARIPDAEARRLLDAAIPHLRAGDYANATHTVVEGVIGKTGGTSRAATPIAATRGTSVARPPKERVWAPPGPMPEAQSGSAGFSAGVIGVIALIVGVGVTLAGAYLRTYADAAALVNKVETDEELPLDHVEAPPMGRWLLALLGIIAVAGGFPFALGMGVGPLVAAVLGGALGYLVAPLLVQGEGYSGSGTSRGWSGDRSRDSLFSASRSTGSSFGGSSSIGRSSSHGGSSSRGRSSWGGGGGRFGGGGATSRW
jgi:uncharacterized protein